MKGLVRAYFQVSAKSQEVETHRVYAVMTLPTVRSQTPGPQRDSRPERVIGLGGHVVVVREQSEKEKVKSRVLMVSITTLDLLVIRTGRQIMIF